MWDLAITPDILCKIKPYQRISQFPGILVVANKSKLGRNLNKMQKFYPDEYDFFPQTFVLPVEKNEFKR
jgi:tubulin polyglutamylase TTLL6/13